MSTGFYWDEQCFWHGGGNYAMTLPVGGLVEPLAAGGLPDSPDSKRRLKNLLDTTGLLTQLNAASAPMVTRADLERVHPVGYLDQFKSMSDENGGEIGLRAPFGKGGYDIARQSAGLAKAALYSVLSGENSNAYALSRPPGHHCLPDHPNGFCLLANIAIAIESARADKLVERVAVLDWDVHHGNGTEAIYYDDPNVLTVSMHQEHNYPMDTGDFADRGHGRGEDCNLNIPLPPGTGHVGYLMAMDRLAIPAIRAFNPDVIIVACGFDAAAIDPLSRMMATAETFEHMTRMARQLALDCCDGKLVLVHEGGYSEVYVPFCGHAVMSELAQSAIKAPDPLAETFAKRQPKPSFDRYVESLIGEMAQAIF